MIEVNYGGPVKVVDQDGVWVENFETVDDAILGMVAGWHEAENPPAFTLRDLQERVVATMCPIGSDSCLVVRDNGNTILFTGIHYHVVDGRISHTQCMRQDEVIKIKG